MGDGAFVAGAIASVLDIAVALVADPLPSLAARLKGRRLLLILDNCEHVIKDAAAAAGTILRTCPGVLILATSRERLGIEGESVYRLPSLGTPAQTPVSLEESFTYAAFRLFMERARAADARLELTEERLATVAEICRRLEGIPLAIELAASRLPTFGFTALNQRLQEHFVIAGAVRDLPQRQKTMLATIAWSYELLSGQERMLLRRLAIFSGGVTLEAAECVCADERLPARDVADLLSLLIDKSLLSVVPGDERVRYAMLESVRAFAANELRAAGEFATFARAHAAWLATVADRADERYPHVPRSRWIREFRAEIDNARAALEWALNAANDDDALLAGRIVGGLRGLWMSTERRVECRRWVAAAMARIDAARYPDVAARVMRAHIQSIDGFAVIAAAEQAIPLFERIGDRRGLISLYAHIAWEQGLRGAFPAAEDSIARAFALAVQERMQRSRQYGRLLQARCLIRALAGRIDEARVDSAEAARLRTALGEDDSIVRFYWEAFFAFCDGNVARAAELLEASIDHARARSQNPAGQLSELAAARLVLDETAAAESAAREALELARFEQLDSGWRAIQHLAAVAARGGRPQTAARLMGFVDAWCAGKGGFRGYYERATHEIVTRALREQLPAPTIAQLATDGASLDFDGAVDLALSP